MRKDIKSFIQYYDGRKIKKLKRKNLLLPIDTSLQIVINVDMSSFEEKIRIKEQSILDALPNDIIICHKKINTLPPARNIEIDYTRISDGGFKVSCYVHFNNLRDLTKFKLKL